MSEAMRPDQSRQLLAAIVDSSDDAIISKDLNGIITSWNRGAQRIFGYSPDEAIGQPVFMLIPEDRLEEEPEILRRIRRGDRIEHFETIRRRKDGKLLNISVTISPIRDDGGKIMGASKIARDITPQLEIQQQLQRGEERFRTTLSSIGDAVIATDRDGSISFMNVVAENLTGWKEDEARGLSLPEVFKIVNEFSRETVKNPVEMVFETGGVVGLANHTLLVAKDGTERPIDDSGAPIREANGGIGGVVLVFRDVTERRTAELAAQRLAAIVNGSDDAIIGKDLTGIITNWNEGARRIFGYEAEEIVGRSILTLIPEELRGEERDILSRLRQGQRIEHFETVRMAKDGRLLEVSITVSPIRDIEGVVIGASKIARDVTERKQVEKALAEAREQLQMHAIDLEMRVEERTRMLQKTIAELEAFSYSLSHDLRAPLRAIQSFLQIFVEDYGMRVDEEGHDILQRVIAAAQRMDRMVLDLLAFTRLSHETMAVEPVDAEKVIREIIQERAEFRSPQAEINIESPLAVVMGNEASLRQCFTNLLDNAVKFVAPGVTPTIRIHSETTDSWVRLWVEDNGLGIRKDEQRQLFRMFHRAHGKEYAGTGIGLAIVRKAAERMGGSAGIESEPGQGSRFWLQLPGATI